MANESEPNNSLAEADDLLIDDQATGNLDTSEDEDYFRVTVGSAGLLSLQLDVPTDEQWLDYFSLTVLDAAEQVLGSYRAGQDGTYYFGLASAGTYYVRLAPYESLGYLWHDDGTYGLTATFNAGATSSLETEVNDSFADADTLIPDDPFYGQLSSENDTDYFSFNTTGASLVSVTIDLPPSIENFGSRYYTLALFAEDGSELGLYDVDWEETFNFAVSTAGSYFLRVRPFTDQFYTNFEPDLYSLTVNLAPVAPDTFETEDNNSSGEADPLTTGTMTAGQLASADDLDFFQLTVGAPVILSAAFDSPFQSTDAYDYFFIGLLDSNGDLIAQYQTGSDESFRFALPGAGTFFFRITNYESQYQTFFDSGQYGLTVTETPDPVATFESEFNNSMATADPLPFGSTVGAQLSSTEDVDYFRLDLGDAGALSVLLDVPTDSAGFSYFTLALVDSANNVIGQYQPIADQALNFGVPAAGSYYLRMTDASEQFAIIHDPGEYSLTASFTPGAVGNFEIEPNNSQQTANSLTLGTAIGGQLATDEDHDFFGFSIIEPGLLTVDFDVPTDYDYENYFTLTLLDHTGDIVGQYDTGEDFAAAFGVAEAGDYYLQVTPWSWEYWPGQFSISHDSGQYSLLANLDPGAAGSFESEDNNSIANADELTLDSVISGQLASTDDQDYFGFTADGSGSLSVTLDVPTDSDFANYFTLTLVDGTETVLGQYQTGIDQIFTLGVPAAGDYYLRLTNAGADFSTYYDSGQYSLLASLALGTGLFESENNDGIESADELAADSEIRGQLSDTEDEDFFQLSDVTAGVLTVSFDSPADDLFNDYFDISLYDAGGVLLSRQSTGTDLAYQTGIPVDGDYFVAVSSDEWVYDSGLYGLTLSVSAGGSQTFEQEPNDEVPNFLLPDSPVTGQVSSPTDIDWYYFDSDSPGTLQASLDVPSDDEFIDYFRVQVLDDDGNLLASRASGSDFAFDVGLTDSGRYLVGVSSAGYGHDSGNYQLELSLDNVLQAQESESNDSFGLANLITTGAPVRGQMSSDDDLDYFQVAASESGVLTVNFDSPITSSRYNYYRISVYDQEENLLTSRDTGYDLGFQVDVEQPGDYYVVVSAFSFQFDDRDYFLAVDVLIDDPVAGDALTGTAADDFLVGTDQDDLIYGLGGNDLIDGGEGIDTVAFRTGADRLTINSIEGLTAVRGGFAAGEHAYTVSRLWNVEKIRTQTGIEELGLLAASPLLGSSQADILLGTESDDLIDGLGGNDFIDGGGGDDLLALFGAEEQFEIVTVSGITRIVAAESTNEYAGSTIKTIGVEQLGFNQSRFKPLETTTANKIIGAPGADVLFGTSEDDVFDGAGGDDTIDGGAGSDTVVFFGKIDEFQIQYPDIVNGELRITGQAGSLYKDKSVVAVNIEEIAFTDAVLSVTNPPRVVLTPQRTLLAEGGASATLGVSLSVAPAAPVTVYLDGGNQLSTDVPQLVFDTDNWDLVQLVSVSAIDDGNFEQQHSGSLAVSVSSEDALYSELDDSSLTFLISDNDAGSFGSVAGRIWNDANKNGLLDDNENGFGGWIVFDDSNGNGQQDEGEPTTYTDVAGYYRLEGLEPGSHLVATQSQKGWVPTFPDNSGARAVIIDNRSTSDDVILDASWSPAVYDLLAIGSYQNLGTATNIAAFHNDPRFADIDGQGYSVVVVDSGIDTDHPFFGADLDSNGIADRIVYQQDFYGTDDFDASDGFGHGTHVAGIIGSSDSQYPGIAPGVNLIVLKIFSDTGRGDNGHALKEALTWATQHVDEYNIAAVNLSVGFGNFHTSPYAGFLSTEFASLANQGVVVVSASGNSYDDQPGTLGVDYPSSDPFSLSVGAVWASPGSVPGVQDGVTDAVAFFSQRDDELSDIFAPGVFIDSAALGGGPVAFSGTSMASPEIAGMVVLAQQLAERELGRRLTFPELQTLLRETGDPIVDGDDENDNVPNTGLTFYRIDMLAFAEAILELKPPASYAVDVVAGGTVSDKDFGFTASEFIQGLDADELIFGTAGGEIIRGGEGADEIRGGAGDDELFGEGGDDYLVGEEGDDYVDGGADNDLIVAGGGAGNDTYDGGPGIDTITYNSASAALQINLSTGVSDSVAGNNAAGTGTDSLTGIENIIGSGFADLLTGNDGANQISAGAGNDTIVSGLGNDTVIGDAGIDVLRYSGEILDYSITRIAASIEINSLISASDDLVSSVERLQFDDLTRAYDLDGNAGFVARMLGVMLGKDDWNNPEYVGIGVYYLEQAGLTQEELMQTALDFVLGSTPESAAIVNLVYGNVVGQPPSPSELAEFSTLLDNGTYTPASFGLAAAAHEFNEANINLVGLLDSGLDYLPLA